MSATVLVVVGGIIAATITGLYQLSSTIMARNERRTDRAVELHNRRRDAYERYLAAFNGYSSLYALDPPLAENSKEKIEAVKEYWLAYGSLFQIASDLVLLAASDFHKVGWMQDTDSTDAAYFEEFKTLYATMIIEMRKDVFERTTLSPKEVEERIPVDFSTQLWS